MDSILEFPELHHIHCKTPIDPGLNRAILCSLKLAAIQMRRKVLLMGHANHIRLHYGAIMSMVEIMTTLYGIWLNVDPMNPTMPDRDRFVLSKGHGAPGLYVALWLRGFFGEEHFFNFRRLNSILQGHPDKNKTPGVECSTGSLGQGMPVACGMALGVKIDQSPFRVYAYLSDGECNEGSVWEAAQIASNLKLDKLTVLLDRNLKSSYGLMKDRNDVEPLADKWRAFNWEVFECDGHEYIELTAALAGAEQVKGKPSVIICHTLKGKGLPFFETVNTKAHVLLSEEEYQGCLDYLAGDEEEIRHG